MLGSLDGDISFDGIDIVSGLQQMGDFFQNLPNYGPSFGRIGTILNRFWSLFPNDYWFALIILLICFTIQRVIVRRH